MPDEVFSGEWPRFDDDHDPVVTPDHPRVALVTSTPGGLARLMRVVEAVRED